MPLRETFLCSLAAITLLLTLVCGCHDSSQIDCQIVGHSMAPTFKSQHGLATCDECGFEFACDVVTGDGKRSAPRVCGNCGCQNVEKIVPQVADQVKLSLGHPVGRWDVVAFRRGERVLVKRVIGLPGETVDFSAGNLMIDGQIAQKPEDIRKEVSTCVFDSKPAGVNNHSMNLKERIVPREEAAWDFSGEGIFHKAAPVAVGDNADTTFDFLDYRHRKCYKHSGDPTAPVAIDDSNPFNQSIRRSTNRVDELDVRVEAAFIQTGSIRIQRETTSGHICATVELSADQTVALILSLKHGESIKIVEREGMTVAGGKLNVSLVNYDDVIHFLVNEMDEAKVIRLELPVELPENAERPKIDESKPAVSVGISREDSITIKRISIWRDWYLYQDAPKPSVRLPLQTSKRGYYVVGDNLPVSEDSRHFGSVEDIIGVVQPVGGK